MTTSHHKYLSGRKTSYQVSDVHDHDEEGAVPVGDGELDLPLHPARCGADGRLHPSGRSRVQAFGLIISGDGMEEGVDQVALEAAAGTSAGLLRWCVRSVCVRLPVRPHWSSSADCGHSC